MGTYYRNFKGDTRIEGGGRRVDYFKGIWKPLCKDGLLYVRCMVYTYHMSIFNDAQFEIGEFWTFLGSHREVHVDPGKIVLEEVDYGVVTQEVICGASSY